MYVYIQEPAGSYIYSGDIYIFIHEPARSLAGLYVYLAGYIICIYPGPFIYICIRAGQRTARLLYIYMYMLDPAKYVYEPANRIYALYIYIINRSVYGRMYDSLSESARPVR